LSPTIPRCSDLSRLLVARSAGAGSRWPGRPRRGPARRRWVIASSPAITGSAMRAARAGDRRPGRSRRVRSEGQRERDCQEHGWTPIHLPVTAVGRHRAMAPRSPPAASPPAVPAAEERKSFWYPTCPHPRPVRKLPGSLLPRQAGWRDEPVSPAAAAGRRRLFRPTPVTPLDHAYGSDGTSGHPHRTASAATVTTVQTFDRSTTRNAHVHT
jgi:hypothetical protein